MFYQQPTASRSVWSHHPGWLAVSCSGGFSFSLICLHSHCSGFELYAFGHGRLHTSHHGWSPSVCSVHHYKYNLSFIRNTYISKYADGVPVPATRSITLEWRQPKVGTTVVFRQRDKVVMNSAFTRSPQVRGDERRWEGKMWASEDDDNDDLLSTELNVHLNRLLINESSFADTLLGSTKRSTWFPWNRTELQRQQSCAGPWYFTRRLIWTTIYNNCTDS